CRRAPRGTTTSPPPKRRGTLSPIRTSIPGTSRPGREDTPEEQVEEQSESQQ
ncbi:unnamed protein product, partial [Amoebophrya sp. A25]